MTVVTRCHILRLKCTKFGFGAGGAYSAPPDPLAGFNWPTFKGREGSGWEVKGWEEGGKEGKEKRKGGLAPRS